MKKRIAIFAHDIRTEENPNGYRVGQYFPYFENKDFEVLHLTSKTLISALIQMFRRADAVYVQRLLLDSVKRYLLDVFAKRIVFDFDDAIMYGPGTESRTRRRRFRGMVELSDTVFCGNNLPLSEAGKYEKKPLLRKTMGRKARETVEERYCLRTWGPRVADIIGNL